MYSTGETNDESNTHNDVINNIDDASGNLQQPTNGRKDSSTIQQYNIPMGTSVVPVVDLVLTIVARLRWGKVVVISDSTNPYQLNSFYSTLSHRLNPQSSASQSSAAEDYSSDDTFSTLNNFLQLYRFFPTSLSNIECSFVRSDSDPPPRHEIMTISVNDIFTPLLWCNLAV